MKKSIQTLVSKINESENGKLKGGFGSLKGGMQLPSTNEKCTNGDGGRTCSSTNTVTCENKGDCGSSSNSGTCTNSGTCFA